MVAMVVVLPAPLPPRSPVIEPGVEREGNAVDRRDGLVDFDEAIDGYGRGRPASRTCGALGAPEARGEQALAEADRGDAWQSSRRKMAQNAIEKRGGRQ